MSLYVDKCATKIENLNSILPVLETAKEKEFENDKKSQDELLIECLEQKFGNLSVEEQKLRSHWITRQLLGPMYLDRAYLDKLIKQSSIYAKQICKHF